MTVKLIWDGKDEAHTEARRHENVIFVEKKSNENVLFGDAFDVQEHNLIIGDNLTALKGLINQQNMAFDFIYIDPPYNTGQRFSFLDSAVTQRDVDPASAWLNMMYPRIHAAKQLMSEVGVIFVSIDDRELATLTLLMQEIFGKENHLATLKWRKKRKPSFLDKHISSVIEYILVFAKNPKKAAKLLGEKSTELTRPVLNAGNPPSERILKRGVSARCADGVYKKGIYKNRSLEIELLSSAEIINGELTSDVSVRGRFRVSQAVLDESVFVTSQFGLRRTVSDKEQLRRHASDDCTSWATNEDAEAELKKHFGKRVFDFPKPVGMLKNLLKMFEAPKDGGNLRCLDFFAGSGTLAEAVLQLNAEDGQTRTFCCVQSETLLPENQRTPELSSISDVMQARVHRTLASHPSSLSLKIRFCKAH